MASDHLGSDIALLDISEVSDFTDFFVIVTGETSRHLEAVANDVTRSLRKKKVRPLHREPLPPFFPVSWGPNFGESIRLFCPVA